MRPFKDFVETEEIFPNVFLVKNFLSNKECKEILNSKTDNFNTEEIIKSFFQLKKSNIIIDRLKNYVIDDLIVYESTTGSVMKKGYYHPIHEDNPHGYLDREANLSIIPGEPITKLKSHAWGTVLYLSNFMGGEIFYPNYMEYYSPSAGDLIVHSSEVDMPHGTMKAKDNNRYIHTTFFYRLLDVPTKYIEEGLKNESDIMNDKYGWPKWLNV